MSATRINNWLDAHHTAPRVRELGVSALATVALFAAALASMTSLRDVGVFHPTVADERVRFVPVPVPTPAPMPVPVPQRPAIVPPPSRVAAPIERAPATIAPAPPIVRVPAPPRDTAVQPVAAPTVSVPLSIEPAKTPTYVPHTAIGGAPISPVAVGGHAPMTARMRDSILAGSMAEVPGLAAAEKHAGVKLPARANGEPVIGGGMSIPVPIFEPGPSAAQRKRDAVVAAENQARLYRLEDRLYQKRDSIRLDSLRRDSLAKHKPGAPPP